MERILVTGGCGFIGSNFIHYILQNTQEYKIINLDALTYAGNKENLKDIENDPRYEFIYGRVEDRELVEKLVKEVDYIIHFAAESHVDRSIDNSYPFIITNILGTHSILEAVKNSTNVKKYIHISTDEVYGALGVWGRFTEDSPLQPNSPYSASKASADLLVRSYIKTYRIPAVIIRPSNNYGPFQFPEKFLPLMITNLLEDKPIPIYGKGENIRDWLFVSDTCKAIFTVLKNGKIGEVYNVGGGNEVRNIDMAKMVLKLMGKGEEYIQFVPDRPGHDYRYALDSRKIKEELGWVPEMNLIDGVKYTIEWYKNNEWWWKPLKERLKKESKGFWTS